MFKPFEDEIEYNYTNYKKDKEDKIIKTLPWIEKYRPDNLDDIIFHQDIINTLKNFINNKCLPHLLFYGPPGSGKTSTITSCANKLYGEYSKFMVLELNASDDRGIEVVRTKIKQFATSKSVFYNDPNNDNKNIFKLVILDETDAMTDDAQANLRKVVEEYTQNTRFCLICNYIQKIIPALQSRCTRFRFSPLPNNMIKKKIKQIVVKESIKSSNKGIDTVTKRSNGDLRKALNILQATYMTYHLINEKNVNLCIGYPDDKTIEYILSSLYNDKFNIAYHNIKNIIKNNGLSLNDVIQELHDNLINRILSDDFTDKLNIHNICFILDNLRDIEFNQSVNSIDDIQISAFIGVFKKYLD